MTSTPLHHLNGKVTLSRTAFRYDDHRKIYRRPRPLRHVLVDLVFTWVLPALALLFVAGCCLVLYWVLSGIVRALG